MSDYKTSGRIGIVTLLIIFTMVLITLKLMDKITVSWWWVWSPIWIPCLAVIAVLIVFYCLGSAKLKRDRRIIDEITMIAKVRGITMHDAATIWASGNSDRAKDIPASVFGKSRWQQKMEELQEAQKQRLNK